MGIALTPGAMENTAPADPAAAFDRDPGDGIVATSRPPVAFRYYDIVMAGFVTILLLSNIIGAAKLTFVDVPFWPQGWWPAPDGVFIYGAGILFFPLGYVIGDVLTEIYGFARARRVIWVGTGALLFLAFMSFVVTALPPFGGWECAASGFGGERPLTSNSDPAIPGGAICQMTYDSVFGSTWRIVVASITAFWAGEFVNSFVLAKMKLWMAGRRLWMRTIGSTLFGEGVDSLLFYPLAFWGTGIIPDEQLPAVMLAQFVAKVGVEVAFTPLTYRIVAWLKRAENEDYYDRDTDFNPFSLRA